MAEGGQNHSDAQWERDVLEKVALAAIAEQRTSRRWGMAFKMLLMIYLFVVLFVGTAILTIDYDVIRPIHSAWRFWSGGFYLWYSVILDVFGVVLLVGLILMALRLNILSTSLLKPHKSPTPMVIRYRVVSRG